VSRNDFVHLHVHTEASLLDGLASAGAYVDRAAELGMPALADTNHGNLNDIPDFYKRARKAGVEPVIGCEFYWVEDAERAREEKDSERCHITVLARGEAGYRVLSELSTRSHEQFYYKPLLDRRACEEFGDRLQHLQVLSGCAGSQLSQHLMAGDDLAAREELLWWRETFPNYAVELMHHGTSFDQELNAKLLDMATKYDLRYVITNDPHYAVPEDARTQEALLAIGTNAVLDAPGTFKFEGSGYWLKSRAEMRRTWERRYGSEVWKRGARETLVIAEECHTRIAAWEQKTFQIPPYPEAQGDPMGMLKKRCLRRMRELGQRDLPEYRRRLRHELGAIGEAGIADFLLITADVDDWARSEGIRVGPGRGSVAGTLVGFYIGIHDIDPVKYKLTFERFLNIARPKMPDIDTDFSKRRRGEVFDYAINKYGAENTMSVAQFGTMKIAAAFNLLGQAFGLGFHESQQLNKKIVEEVDPETEEVSVLLPPELDDPKYHEMRDILLKLKGVRRTVGAHPAGLIIAAPEHKLREQVPMYWVASSKRWVAGFDKKGIEALGLLKQDFLGLRALDTVDEFLDLVEANHGVRLVPEEWVPDEEEGDDEVYAMLAEGKTAGVFQMEGPTNQRGCRDVQPKEFEDLVSITSLYRTGAISAGFPKIFNANRKLGKRGIRYAHPALKPILRDTYGVVLYQEQVMDFGSKLAGFDMVQVDMIKEAIKDKSSDDMQALRDPFIVGCQEHSGMTEEQAAEVWHMIEGYAGYGYNRAHAVAYTMLTYWTARMKWLYPVEYMAALLRTVENNKDNADRRDGYMREAVEWGAKFVPPSVNVSHRGTTPGPPPEDGPQPVYFGLMDLKGIGEKVADKILAARPEGGYESYEQLAAAVNNKGTMRVLEEGSALECLGVKGDTEKTEELLRWTFEDKMKKYRSKYETEVRLPSEAGPDGEVSLVGMLQTVTRGTTKGGKSYVTWKLRWSVTESFDVRLWQETQKFWDLLPGSVVQVMGTWEPKWLNVSCGNPRMIKVIKGLRVEESTE
jgi:DNA polymerase-3 subunit alpha